MRVLDFPHAVEHLGQAAQAVLGPGTAAGSAWLSVQAHPLRHGREETVLVALAGLAATPGLGEAARAVVGGVTAYLTSRRAQIHYQRFADAGYPIGSGCVESANKLVVEARLKGAGMHWSRANVDPLLALRCLLATGRWDETWPTLWRVICRSRRRRPPAIPPAPSSLPAPGSPTPGPPPATPPPSSPRPKLVVDGKPTKDHPWKCVLALHAKS